jgi:hypothetical protein
MDIEFVELEHREDITNLMEVCGMDLPSAYELYHQHQCNLQVPIPPCRQPSAKLSAWLPH